MNGRKLFREYAKYRGHDCVEFDKIEPEFYSLDDFFYKDSEGKRQCMTINYTDMVHWIIKAFPNTAFENMKEVRDERF